MTYSVLTYTEIVSFVKKGFFMEFSNLNINCFSFSFVLDWTNVVMSTHLLIKSHFKFKFLIIFKWLEKSTWTYLLSKYINIRSIQSIFFLFLLRNTHKHCLEKNEWIRIYFARAVRRLKMKILIKKMEKCHCYCCELFASCVLLLLYSRCRSRRVRFCIDICIFVMIFNWFEIDSWLRDDIIQSLLFHWTKYFDEFFF